MAFLDNIARGGQAWVHALKIPAEKWLECQMERRLWEERRRRENPLPAI